MSLDPAVAGEGTTLLLGADDKVLIRDGEAARSIAFALPRGMRVDAGSRESLCSRRAAARGSCPDSSRIGFGRYSIDLRGYRAGGGETVVAWGIDAFLGEPQRRGDAASVVLISNLHGADLVGNLLAPELAAALPRSTTTLGSLRRTSGAYGLELAFAQLPVTPALAPPASATPDRLTLTLGAVRRVRQDFFRRFRVRTPSGTEVRKIRDHRLIGRHLFRNPAACRGGWRGALRVGFAGGTERGARRLECTSDA